MSSFENYYYTIGHLSSLTTASGYKVDNSITATAHIFALAGAIRVGRVELIP